MESKKLEYDNIGEGLEDWRDDLKDCPFCGYNSEELEFEEIEHGEWRIACPHCGASNWCSDNVSELVFWWNTRNGVEWFPQDHI